MTLVTLEELKQWLNIDQSDTSKDIILNIYINGVSEMIIGMIGRNILAEDHIEKYAGTNSNALILKNYPINSVTSIKYIIDNAVYRELDSTEYDINSKSGILYKDLVWGKIGGSSLMSQRINYPRRHIRIEYNAGYAEVPADLKLLALQLIKSQLGIDSSEGASQGLKSYSISDVKMEWKEDVKLSQEQIAIVNKYRAVNI
ncbi:head-tail connector protein [Clostridium brassicae]|uniref:Phage gp6-like head-tail connector protein n=1 Tax=Clostridium brassicae TaxID=2999072 RepID=A0ABT4D6G4_9CLOT|nr:head-tail connector protein [Clostridium brassicae]MCY6957883.1 phage gp6-like head-tail connector protein [Clostridium brassicae]